MNYGEHAKENRFNWIKKVTSALIFVLSVVIIQFFLSEYVAQAYEVPTGSMESTIQVEDRLFGEKITYRFSDVKAGDIVTFEDPQNSERVLIKRCIATEGQTLDLIDGQVYIDGVALYEPYVEGKPTPPLQITLHDIKYPLTIPDDHIWVMGDNRIDSLDSRYFGPIPTSSVYSKAFVRFWPLDRAGTL